MERKMTHSTYDKVQITYLWSSIREGYAGRTRGVRYQTRSGGVLSQS